MAKDLSPSEIIDSGEWHEALFFTYALSLSFFESVLLPQLRRCGCSKVAIYADKLGYRTCLIERRALAVGQDYMMVPVAKRGGIFHPKCIYLMGIDRDLLLVGSGNLTFGGHGKNVEVVEVLDSSRDREAFTGFGSFIEGLLASEGVIIPHKQPLQSLARRIARLPRTGPSSDARILHSVVEPIYQQFARAARQLAHPDTLLVLSPFHHPGAKPIADLASELNVKRVLAGVPSGSQPSAFPFEAARSWKQAILPVQPDVTKTGRPLHAKWWEVRSKDLGITLTGSVNATIESCQSTRNVELGVIRGPSRVDSTAWKEAKRPAYQPTTIDTVDAEGVLALFAYLSVDGMLAGSIVGGEDLAGKWHVAVLAPDPRHMQASVDSQGSFRIEFSLAASTSDPLQITLTRGAVIARGWLNFGLHLSLSPQQRAIARIVEELAAGKENDDDFEMLLMYIATESSAGLRALDTQASSPKAAEAKTASDGIRVSTQELFLGEDPAYRSAHHIFARAGTVNADRLSIIYQVASRLLAAPSSGAASAPGFARIEAGAEEDSDEAQAAKAEESLLRGREALAEFNSRMSRSLREVSEFGFRFGLVMNIWLNVNFAMHVSRFGDKVAAIRFATNQWLPLLMGTKPTEEALRSLGAPAAAICALAGSSRLKDLGAGVPACSSVREWIEGLWRGEDVQATLGELARRWAASSSVTSSLAVTPEEINEGLGRVLSTPTVQTTVYAAWLAVRDRRQFDVPQDVLGAREAAILKAIFGTPTGRRRTQIAQSCPSGCPKCYLHFDEETARSMSRYRVAECRGCDSVVLWVGQE